MPDRSGCAVRAGTLPRLLRRQTARREEVGFPAGTRLSAGLPGMRANSAVLNAADGPDRHCLARFGRPVGAAFMARRIENPISFRAETVGEPLVWGIGGYPQFGALNFEGPVVNAACGRLGAGSQQEGEQQKNRRTHSSPGSINDRARLAQLAPPLKSVCCRTGMSRPLRCLRPRKPKLPTRANQRAAFCLPPADY